MPTTARSHDVGHLLGLGTVILVVALITGCFWHLTSKQWLGLALGASLALWIGGAMGGQIVLARLLDRGADPEVFAFTRQLLAVILGVFIPMSLVAVASGLALVLAGGVPLLSAKVLVPLGLYATTCVLGTVFSGPGYARLLRHAEASGVDHPDFRRRLMRLAWLNRAELALVIGIGLPTIISLV